LIPRANITAWRTYASWPSNEQVEQDLVLSRAMVEMFSQALIADQIIVRGGTALNKFFFSKASRYSEDIDLVQRNAGPIGKIINTIRDALDPWLGKPKWKQGKGQFTLFYRFNTTFVPVTTMRLKIEINTREHFSVFGTTKKGFPVDNPWFNGTANIPIYHFEELLGTKLRALFQRKKGRDLFDLWLSLKSNCNKVIKSFQRYIEHDGTALSRAEFAANLAEKMNSIRFTEDVNPLIPADINYNPVAAAEIVQKKLISKLPGRQWKGKS